ncbi:MAG: ribonuclease R [Planctomycetaceae bacterium]|nr:ribonuclease R [Planctomycetaceae bacterium]
MAVDAKLLEYLSLPNYEPMTVKSLAKKLGYKKKVRDKVDQAVERLVTEGKVQVDPQGLVHPTNKSHALRGILRKVSTGNGYVILQEPKPAHLTEDLFIDRRDLGDAQTGDEVAVVLLKRRRSNGQQCGRIIEVIQRATNRFVGTYFEEDGQGYVFVDGKNYEEAIWVGDPGAKGARLDDKVVIEMIRFPTQYAVGEAVLIEVLGARGQAGVDTLSIIHEYGLPTEFSLEAVQQAAHLMEKFDEKNLEGRMDLTHDPIVTIDPATARDFDDAISLTETENGHFHLGVHIADVSHFVQPNTPLDRDAYIRGTSVYLPTRVIPMLPEVLSNGLASLQEGRVRFVKSVFIEFNPEGIPVDVRFANSAIKVRKRFSYEQVMDFLLHPENHPELEVAVSTLLLRMQKLARILRSRRFSRGALELSMPEIVLQFNAEGRVAGAEEAVNDESHQIIEEFMLAANIAVATELNARGVQFLRRIHPPPSPEKVQAFQKFIESLGLELPQAQSRESLQELLDQTAGTPLQRSVHFSFLRSLQQAEYSPEEMGHYALAADDYCHFTSPIRRYPDLTIHRIIDRLILRGEKYGGESYEHLMKAGLHCSETERRAERAERELKRLKLLEYMEQFIGKEFDAVVTGVEKFGLFCQCLQVPAEGMIHISDLSDLDQFYYDRDARCLVGKGTNLRLRLGLLVRIRIVHVDLDRRELDMKLVKLLESANEASPAAKIRKSPRKVPRNNSRKPAPAPRSSKNSSGNKRKRKK